MVLCGWGKDIFLRTQALVLDLAGVLKPSQTVLRQREFGDPPSPAISISAAAAARLPPAASLPLPSPSPSNRRHTRRHQPPPIRASKVFH